MENKTVFITGASSGLGMQMAREFAGRGFSLGLAARRLTELERLRDEIQERYKACRIVVYELDVQDTEAVFSVIERAHNDLGRLDIVIANAGIGKHQKIAKGDFSPHRDIINVNVTGAMATIDAAVRVFRRQGFGQIVGISSVASALGTPGLSSYAASKAALRTYMDTLRTETLGENITVSILKPGYIDTPMNHDVPNRPFVIPLEKGGKLLVNEILKGTRETFVPRMPWNILAPVLARMPARLIARLG